MRTLPVFSSNSFLSVARILFPFLRIVVFFRAPALGYPLNSLRLKNGFLGISLEPFLEVHAAGVAGTWSVSADITETDTLPVAADFPGTGALSVAADVAWTGALSVAADVVGIGTWPVAADVAGTITLSVAADVAWTGALSVAADVVGIGS